MGQGDGPVGDSRVVGVTRSKQNDGTPGRAGNGDRWSQADGGHERIARDGGAAFRLG